MNLLTALNSAPSLCIAQVDTPNSPINISSFETVISALGILYLAYVGIGALQSYYEFLKERYVPQFSRVRRYLATNTSIDMDRVEVHTAAAYINRSTTVLPKRVKEIFLKSSLFCVIVLVYIAIKKNHPAAPIQMLANLGIFFCIHLFWRILFLLIPISKKNINLEITKRTINQYPSYPFQTCYDFKFTETGNYWFKKFLKIIICIHCPKFIAENTAFDMLIRLMIFFFSSLIVFHSGFWIDVSFGLLPSNFSRITTFFTLALIASPYLIAFLLDAQMIYRIHKIGQSSSNAIDRIHQEINQDILTKTKLD